ncbi:MAG: 50S ribosomal protein L7ae [Firmicutes bacterium]|nr:50S ribosomal protein L7ae [Bacillota bacterium]
MKPQALLGFARAAGRIVMGRTAVKKAVVAGRVHLLIVAEDAAQGTVGEFEYLATEFTLPLVRFSTMDELGQMVGRSALAVVGVTDRQFAQQLERALSS